MGEATPHDATPHDATLRRMCAAMLLLQAIVVGLSTPVLIHVADVGRATALLCGLGIAGLCVVVAGLLRIRWAYWFGHLLQFATIALGFFEPSMFAVGGLFALLWFTAYLLGRRIEDDRTRWAAEGDGSPPPD